MARKTEPAAGKRVESLRHEEAKRRNIPTHLTCLRGLQSRIETVADEEDLEEVHDTERHLLYVACTRAAISCL